MPELRELVAEELSLPVTRARAALPAAQASRDGCANRAHTDTLLVFGPLRRSKSASLSTAYLADSLSCSK